MRGDNLCLPFVPCNWTMTIHSTAAILRSTMETCGLQAFVYALTMLVYQCRWCAHSYVYLRHHFMRSMTLLCSDMTLNHYKWFFFYGHCWQDRLHRIEPRLRSHMLFSPQLYLFKGFLCSLTLTVSTLQDRSSKQILLLNDLKWKSGLRSTLAETFIVSLQLISSYRSRVSEAIFSLALISVFNLYDNILVQESCIRAVKRFPNHAIAVVKARVDRLLGNCLHRE